MSSSTPDDVRHDVYLTILHGVFNKGTKRADKNVEIDVEVIDDKEQLLEVMWTHYMVLCKFHCFLGCFCLSRPWNNKLVDVLCMLIVLFRSQRYNT